MNRIEEENKRQQKLLENETKRKEKELKKAELSRKKELAREKRKQNDGPKSKIASHSRTKGVP